MSAEGKEKSVVVVLLICNTVVPRRRPSSELAGLATTHAPSSPHGPMLFSTR